MSTTATANTATGIANIATGIREFPEDRFATIENVPVFVEHETLSRPDSDGRRRKLRFTRRELDQIVDKCNQRIEETGDYAAVVVGHTPKDPKGPTDMPELVGFAGPFKSGKLPNGKDAILADFHLHRNSLSVVEKHPRRSPELWLADDYKEMFFDPISLLGADAPRLDMGMTPLFYSRQRAGQIVETYSAVCPSPGSVMVPSRGEKEEAEKFEQPSDDISAETARKMLREGCDSGGHPLSEDQKRMLGAAAGREKNARGEGPPAEDVDDTDPADSADDADAPKPNPSELQPEHEESDMALSPEDVQQIVSAIEATDWAQWVKQKMQADQAAATAAAAPPAGASPEAATPPAIPPATPPETPSSAPPKPDEQKQYAAGDDSESTESESEGKESEPHTESDGDENREKKMEYAKLKTDLAVIERRVATVEKYAKDANDKLETERSRRINAERRAMLQDKRRAFALDLDKELERCRYSRMSDEQFSDHLTLIDENYQRIPEGVMLPESFGGEADADRPGGRNQREKYNKAASDKAVKIAKAKAERGQEVDYAEILEQVKAGEKVK